MLLNYYKNFVVLNPKIDDEIKRSYKPELLNKYNIYNTLSYEQRKQTFIAKIKKLV